MPRLAALPPSLGCPIALASAEPAAAQAPLAHAAAAAARRRSARLDDGAPATGRLRSLAPPAW